MLDPTPNAATDAIDTSPTVISLNYDIIADNAFVEHSGRLPNYGCDITTQIYQDRKHYGTCSRSTVR